MDTRRADHSRQPLRSAVELGTDTGSFDLVELVEIRYAVSPRHHTSVGSIISGLAVFAVVLAIVSLAIATSQGWSILDAY